MTQHRSSPAALLTLLAAALAGCPEASAPDLDAPLPARLLDPGRPPPEPVAIPEAKPPPPPPDPGPAPPPPGGDPKARAVVLGRASPDSVVERAPDGSLSVGVVTISADRRSLSVPGRVNQREGIVEYFAVGPKGKTHESVLVLDVDPTHLMVGCLVLGLDPAPLAEQQDAGLRVVRGERGADPAPPDRHKGSLVRLDVAWRGLDGKTAQHRAEALLWSRERRRSMRPSEWAFTGSSIWRGNFVAELDQSYVATWPDRSALFNTPLPSRNPYRGQDFGFEANRRLLPPVGTALTLTVTRLTP